MSTFLAKTAAMTATIFVTTADDALWLIPFLTSPYLPISTKVIHATMFILTLQFVVWSMVLAVYFFGRLVTNVVDKEIYLSWIAAILAWVIALYLYLKKLWKRRRKRRQRLLQQQEQQGKTDEEENRGLVSESNAPEYHATAATDSVPNDISSSSSSSSSSGSSSSEDPENLFSSGDESARPGTVFSLSFLGALDEIAYFPTLLIGNAFSPLEMALGALLSCLIIILLITTIVTKVQPLLDFMDRIPLYVIVSLFAFFLTADALWETLEW